MITYAVLIFLSITTCQGRLPTPNQMKIITFDPPGFTVKWAPVMGDEENPVAGFKVKVWESETINHYHYEHKDGMNVLVKEVRLADTPSYVIPKTTPLVQTVGPNVTEARFEGIKPNEDYEIRVQAYNDKGEDGPYSNPIGIKLHHRKK